MKSDFSVQNNVVNVCCSYLSMVFPYIGNVKYPHGRTYQPSDERSQTPNIALHFTGRPLLSLFFFAGSYGKFSFRHEWFLIIASLKVRPRTDDKDVSQDSCCFSGFSRGVARIFPEVRETFSTSSPTTNPPPPLHPLPRQISTFFKY